MAWTTTELLADVRRAAMLPASSNSATADADLLAHLDAELQARLVPLLLMGAEDYLVRLTSLTVSANTARYGIPRRAVGARVRDVALVTNGVRHHLPRLRLEQRDSWLPTATGLPTGFYLDAGDIVLLPTPVQAGTLEVHFYARPGTLIATTAARAVTGVTVDTDYFGAGALGRTRLAWTGAFTFTNVADADFVSYRSPFEMKAAQISVNTGAGAQALDYDSDDAALTTTPVALDWVCNGGESPVPQIPMELWPVLVEGGAARVLRAGGYGAEAQAHEEAAKRYEEAAMLILAPRSDGNPKRVTGGALRLVRRASSLWRW